MATVQSKTSIKIDDLVNDTVISGQVSANQHLILITRGGAQIDAGYVGGSGSGGGGSVPAQRFNFPVASQVWTAVHNLGTLGVDVRAFDANNIEMEVEVAFPDVNTVRVTWYYPATGYLIIDT